MPNLIILLIGILSFSNLNGQVKYDTSIIRTEPCTVKKVTMKYDTILNLKGQKWKCDLNFYWPRFYKCKSPEVDSTLNYTLKHHILQTLDDKSAKEVCTIEKMKGKGKFTIQRLDDQILCVSIYFSSFYFGGSFNSHSITFNYNLEEEKVLSLPDILNAELKEEFFALVRERFYKKFDYSARHLELNRFHNNKYYITIYPDEDLAKKIKFKKREIKKYLKKEYYH